MLYHSKHFKKTSHTQKQQCYQGVWPKIFCKNNIHMLFAISFHWKKINGGSAFCNTRSNVYFLKHISLHPHLSCISFAMAITDWKNRRFYVICNIWNPLSFTMFCNHFEGVVRNGPVCCIVQWHLESLRFHPPTCSLTYHVL